MKSILKFLSNMILIGLFIWFIMWYKKMLDHPKYKWYFRIYLIIAVIYILTPTQEEKYDSRTGSEVWESINK